MRVSARRTDSTRILLRLSTYQTTKNEREAERGVSTSSVHLLSYLPLYRCIIAKCNSVPRWIDRHKTVGLFWIALSRISRQYRIRKNGPRALHNAIA
jgi:hypothetical protein